MHIVYIYEQFCYGKTVFPIMHLVLVQCIKVSRPLSGRLLPPSAFLHGQVFTCLHDQWVSGVCGVVGGGVNESIPMPSSSQNLQFHSLHIPLAHFPPLKVQPHFATLIHPLMAQIILRKIVFFNHSFFFFYLFCV